MKSRLNVDDVVTYCSSAIQYKITEIFTVLPANGTEKFVYRIKSQGALEAYRELYEEVDLHLYKRPFTPKFKKGDTVVSRRTIDGLSIITDDHILDVNSVPSREGDSYDLKTSRGASTYYREDELIKVVRGWRKE